MGTEGCILAFLGVSSFPSLCFLQPVTQTFRRDAWRHLKGEAIFLMVVFIPESLLNIFLSLFPPSCDLNSFRMGESMKHNFRLLPRPLLAYSCNGSSFNIIFPFHRFPFSTCPGLFASPAVSYVLCRFFSCGLFHTVQKIVNSWHWELQECIKVRDHKSVLKFHFLSSPVSRRPGGEMKGYKIERKEFTMKINWGGCCWTEKDAEE